MKTKQQLLSIIIISIFGFLLTASTSSYNNEELFYIASNGNDTWSGMLSEPNSDNSDGPLASLDAARIKVRQSISRGLSGPVTVLIRGGEYSLDKKVIFRPEDSGTSEFPVTYRAYPNETPIFTGGKRLENWKKCTKDPEGISEKAKGKLWYCDIPNNLKDKWKITSLYDGTCMLPRSRSKALEVSASHVFDEKNISAVNIKPDWFGEPRVFMRELRYNNDDMRAWKSPGDIEIFISPSYKWVANMLPIEKIDAANKTVYFTITPTYAIKPGDTFYVENAIDYLDEPGEWIFDSAEGRIYIWPKDPLNSADIRAPFLQEFILVEGVEDGTPVRYVQFEGLIFRHGLRDTWQPGDRGMQHDWDLYDKGNAVMRFRHAEDCSVKACTFEASSGAGVRMDLHCQRMNVSDSYFAFLGGTGIVLAGYGPGTKDENKFNTITNNHIHHIASIYKQSPGIFVWQSGHNLISHNTIHDLPYDGLVISGLQGEIYLVMTKQLSQRREMVGTIRMKELEPDLEKIREEILETRKSGKEFDTQITEHLMHSRENRIEYNEIYRVLLEMGDGSGIYLSGMGNNNFVENNYLHNLDRVSGFIRCDNNSTYTIIKNNVGYGGSGAMFIQKGSGIIQNNFVINVGRFSKHLDRYPMEISKNIIYVSKPNTVEHMARFRGNIENGVSLYDQLVTCSNSLFFDLNPPEGWKPGQDLILPERRGSAEVGMLFADPMFDEEAFEQKIFRFKPGSPALKLGIAPIDLSEAGSSLVKFVDGK